MKVSTILATITAAVAGVSAAPVEVPPAPIHPNANLFSLMIVNKHQKDYDGYYLTLKPNMHDGINMIVPSKTSFDRFGLAQGNLYETWEGRNTILWAGFSQWTESGNIRPFAFANDGPQVFTFTEGMKFTSDGLLEIDGKSKWALCTYKDQSGEDYGKVLSWLESPFFDIRRKCDNIDIRRV
ncbi:hypothetical protein ABW19_dt0208662 [Dactylella cylindrospora]|nr:hypothetical protein ABW19_dt0208662 [Dactylella cylindrospora]